MEDKLLLKNQLCFPLYLCSKEIIRRYTPLLNKLDLTYTQYIVMMYLWENKETNIKELGKTLILDSNTLTPLLKKLESKKYITRNKDKNDSRNTIIKLTEEGESLKNLCLTIPEMVGKCVNLTEEEAKTLYTILYKILYNIEKED
jgi:DNA-binding MarR family transcriptional regulator